MTLVDKLLDKLVETDSGCWEFIGGRGGSGYGYISIGYKEYESTHRLAYKLWCGPIPEGMIVCHKCDNKPCCNPDHLFLGTTKDNKLDEMIKGTHVKGSRQGASKLTEDDVLVIKRLIAEGNIPLTQIGRMYGVTSTSIYHIKNGTNWGWLQ